MVSSTAYDLKHELRQIEGVLLGYGYRPIISDRNRMGVNPKSHNFDSCIRAVENCDLFIGIITPSYGTGVKQKGDKSITHLELLKAIDINKPRWMLCHETVVSARTLLNTLAYSGNSLKGKVGRKKLSLLSKSVLKDIRTIDMYESAIRDEVDPEGRTNHWVAQFESHIEILNFIETNFDPEGDNKYFLQEMASQSEPSLARQPSIEEATNAPVRRSWFPRWLQRERGREW